MRKEVYSNFPYIIWILFYFFLFWFIAGGSGEALIFLIIVYGISMLIAISPIAESLYRLASGVRKLSTHAEKSRLLPLYREVYSQAIRKDPNLSKKITLYIQEDMDINAFAFGRGTLVLTKGSIELLNDEQLKGLIAHEFGHFSHFDTTVLLFATVSNLFMLVFMKIIYLITRILLFMVRHKDSIITWCFKIMFWIVNTIYKLLLFIGDLILMPVSREHEYMADAFAYSCGYGVGLADVLSEIYQVSLNNPGSIVEQLRSTHPPLTSRIERLEKLNG